MEKNVHINLLIQKYQVGAVSYDIALKLAEEAQADKHQAIDHSLDIKYIKLLQTAVEGFISDLEALKGEE